MPDSTVTSLAQTPDGYLWVGTPKGLARFDGDSFTRADTAAGTKLEDPAILGLLTDRQGGLWIASESGLITEFAGGRFRQKYPAKAATQGDLTNLPSPSEIRTWGFLKSVFALDSAGSVWVSTVAGELLRFGTNGAREAVSLDDLPRGRLRDVQNDESGRVWLLKGTNCCVLDKGRWIVCDQSVTTSGGILCAGGDQGFWTAEVTRTYALARWNGHDPITGWHSSSTPIPTPPSHPPVSAMLQDRKGRLWLGTTWDGVFVQRHGGEWSRVQERGALAKGTARCLFEDSQGSVWVGMNGQGLAQVLDSQVQMVMLPAEASDVHLTTVCAAKDGSVWMGTDKGLYRRMAQPNAQVQKVEGFEKEPVYAILEDTRTNLWIGTRSGVLLRDGSAFKKVVGMRSPRRGIVSLYEDRAGGIWAGGLGTLLHLPPGAEAENFQRKIAKSSLFVSCIAEDSEGQIWVAKKMPGTPLWRLEGEQLVPAGAPVSGLNVTARSVLCDKEGTLWFGTQRDGLFCWKQRELKHFTTADGLPDDKILGLMSDQQGNLWMTTRIGIVGCSCRQLAEYVPGRSPALLCTLLGGDEGMANRECTGAGQPVIVPGPDGRVWVATMLGAAGFDPDISSRAAAPLEVRIETLRADGQVVEAGPRGYRVPASTRRLEFQYSAPELKAPQSLRFRYRLDGLDQNWEPADARRFASYSQLPAGEYHFRVMVGGPNGSWQEAKMPAILRVVPRFWQTGWFRMLVGAATLLILIGAVAWNERRKARRRLERLEARHAVEQVRRRIARDLHDELGSAITEIVQLGDLTLQSDTGSETLRPSVQEMTGLARRLGIAVDEIVWTMSSRNDTLPNLVGYLSNYAQEFLRHSGIRCRLDVTWNMPNVEVNSKARHNLFLAFKEAVNNAAKHSRADEVVVHLQYAEGVLKVCVEDNGVGFDAGAPAQGEGLKNMRERLEALDGKAEFLPRSDRGTRVVFTMAVGGAVPIPAESPQ